MSIIMLNVDTYNQNVKAERRMSQEAFLKNLRGQNGGADFPKEWLLDIYHSIKESELRIPEEQPLNQEITQGAWRYFLNKFERVHQLTTADGGNALNKSYAGHYDALLFGIAWRQVTAAAKVGS
jgi:brefeldin A-resistance guanine nucleotide exchange factor 1